MKNIYILFVTSVVYVQINGIYSDGNVNFKELLRSNDIKGMDFPEKAKNFYHGMISDRSDNISHKLSYLYWPTISSKGMKNVPTIFFVMGGPGAASTIFISGLAGPIRPSSKHGIKFNKWSWIKFANIVTVDWPYGSGYSKQWHPKANYQTKSELQIVHQGKRWNTFVRRFFVKYPMLSKTDFYFGAESATGMVLLDFWEYADTNNLYGENFKGLLMEAPELTIYRNMMMEAYYYKVFHIMTENQVKHKFVKNKKFLEGKYDNNGQKMEEKRQEFVMKHAKHRYKKQFVNQYDIRQLLNNSPKTMFEQVYPVGQVIKLNLDNHWNFNVKDNKVQKTFGVTKKYSPYITVFFPVTDGQQYQDVNKFMNEKFKKFFKSNKKFIAYFGGYDNACPITNCFARFDTSMDKKQRESFYNMKWKQGYRHVYKKSGNVHIAMMPNAFHAVSNTEGHAAYKFVKKALYDDGE